MVTCPSRRLSLRSPRFGGHLTLLTALFLLAWTGCSGNSTPPADSESGETADADASEDADGESGMGISEERDAAHGDAATADAEPAAPGAAPFDTTFLDVDTELFVHAKVGEILESSLVQMLTGGDLGPVEMAAKQFGLTPQEFDTVTVGVRNLAQVSKSAIDSMPMMGPGPGFGGPGEFMEEEEFDDAADADSADDDSEGMAGKSSTENVVAIIRTKSPINVEKLERDGIERIPYGAKAFYRHTEAAAADEICAYLFDGTTLVFSDEKNIKQIIDQGKDRPRPTADLGFIESAPHLLLAVVPKDKAAFFKQKDNLPFPKAFPPMNPMPGGFSGGALPGAARPGLTPGSSGQSQQERMQQSQGSAHAGGTALPTAGTGPSPEEAMRQSQASAHAGGTALPTASTGPSAEEAMRQSQGSAHAGGTALPTASTGPSPEEAMRQSQGSAHAGGTALPGGPASAASSSGQSLFEQHADAFALLIDLSDGIGVNVAIKCDDAKAAGQIRAEIAQGIDEAKTQFEAAKSMLPGVIQQVAQPVVESLTASSSKSVIMIQAALPEEQQASLPMVPVALMGMMMGGMQMSGGEFDTGPSGMEQYQEVLDNGQPAANADELPEGLELKALARWGHSLYGDQAPAPLEIAIVAIGGPATEAVGFGRLQLAEAMSDEQTQLKWQGTTTEATFKDPVADLIPIEREGMLSNHPEEGVATGFVVVPPANPAASLHSVAGQFVLHVPATTDEVMIANVSRLPGGRVEDQQLASAGMTVGVVDAGGQAQMDVSYAESAGIGRIELVSGDGQPLRTFGSGSSTMNGRKSLMFMFPGRIPDDAGLRVTLHSDLQEVVVPFRFENLPMPEPQELTDEQRAMLVWTRAESPAGLDGLVIEAQGRWRMPEPVMAMNAAFGGGFADDPFGARARGFDSDDSDSDDAESAFTEQMRRQYAAEFEGSQPAGRAAENGRQRAPASEEPLRIVVDLIGPLAGTAEALGMVDVTSVKTDIDTDLAFEGVDFSRGQGDTADEFVEIDHEMSSNDESPPGGLRIVLKLTPPNQPITALSQLNATLKLRTVRERTEAILNDIPERVGEPQGDSGLAAKVVTDRELVKHRIRPYVAIQGDRVMMRLEEGSDDKISDVSMLDLNGNSLTDVLATTQPGTGRAQGRTIWVFEFPGGVPQKVGMKISVNMGIKDVDVPIRIRDLPLPPLPVSEES